MPDYLEIAEPMLARFLERASRAGIEIGQGVSVAYGVGLVSYFDRRDKTIRLGLPAPSEPTGPLRLLLLRELTGCATAVELDEFIALVLPRTLAHELAHYLRDVQGRLSDSDWEEEQIANQFANAFMWQLESPSAVKRLEAMIERSLKHLSRRYDLDASAFSAYHEPMRALSARRGLSLGTAERLALMQRLFGIAPERVLQGAQTLSAEALGQLEGRERAIAGFVGERSSDVARLVYYQFAWTLIDLRTQERHYLGELAKKYLHPGVQTLRLAASGAAAGGIRALFEAARALESESEVLARYLYKRYRAGLLDLIAADLGDTAIERAERLFAFDPWDEGDDALELLLALVPASRAGLFPQVLRAQAPQPWSIEALPDPIDRRLASVALGLAADPPAEETLYRLGALECTTVFRPLPARALLELAAGLQPLSLDAGDVLTWEGTMDADLFLVQQGSVEVTLRGKRVATAGPGDVLGEMEFVRRTPRSATLRARDRVECLVLHAADLQLATCRDPEIFRRLAALLSERLQAR